MDWLLSTCGDYDTMIPDSYNLPPGLAPSGIPGNSPREIAIQHAIEEADHKVNGLVVELHAEAEELDKVFNLDDLDTIHRAIKKSSHLIEHILVRLDDARHILGRVLE